MELVASPSSRMSTLLLAVAGGMLAGALAAAASRVAMRILFLVQPETAGIVVAETFPVGEVSIAGTGAIVIAGVIAGVPVGAGYAAIRSLLSGRPMLRRLEFGLVVLAVLAWPELHFESRDFRLFHQPVWLAPALFGVVLVLLGWLTATLVDRFAGAPRAGTRTQRAGGALLVAVAMTGLAAAIARLTIGWP